MGWSNSRVGAPTVVVACLAVSATLSAAEPADEALKAQIDALQTKIDTLEAKQVSAANVDATVQRVLDDAQRRSQFMAAEGFTAGYSKGGFVIQSADGNYSFSPIAQLQVRYIGNYREDRPRHYGEHWYGAKSSYDDGFEITRAKFGFQGNIVSPDLTYKFLWATNSGNDAVMGRDNPTAGEVTLEEAWGRYKFNDQFSAFAGQFKDIVAKDAFISSSRQLAVDEAVATALLIDNACGYIQGIGATYELVKSLRLTGIYHDGINSQNTNFQNTQTRVDGNSTTEQFGVSGRAEWMIIGDSWRQYDQYTALGNRSDLLVLGAGIDYTHRGYRDATFEGVDLLYQSTDVPGLSLFGAAMGNEVSPRVYELDASNPTAFNYGFIAQIGWLFHKNWEVFGRYDITVFDNNAHYGDDQVQEITAGVNYYLGGQAAKLTFDVVYLPQGFGWFVPSGAGELAGLGILPTNGESQEFVARVQFQLLL